jgi:hypothetical protein
VQPIRDELKRLLDKLPEWDGKVWGLQVTNTTDRSMELRALMGARNASDSWNLRCFVRERLLAFIRDQCPHALARLRVLESAPPPEAEKKESVPNPAPGPEDGEAIERGAATPAAPVAS